MLDSSSIDNLSIENYKIQISKSVFHAYPSYLCRVSFLTTLDIYKDYFKGHLRWCNMMQSDYSLKLWLETICPSSYFFWRSCYVLYAKGFVTKEFLDLYHVDELKNFATNIFLSWCVSHVLGSVYQLDSHVLGAMHWKGEIVTTLQVQLGIGVRFQL